MQQLNFLWTNKHHFLVSACIVLSNDLPIRLSRRVLPVLVPDMIGTKTIMSIIGINSNQEAREKCRTAIGTIRNRCGVNSDTGEKYLGDETSSWCAANFARIGFQRSGDEEKLAELDKKLRIECVVFGDASVKMSGKLLSSKIVEEVN